MWDGIENAGWGVHDENATIWVDLVGGVEWRVFGGAFHWEHDSLVFDESKALIQ